MQPLHRHVALQPLSREHMSGLIQARLLHRACWSNRDVRASAIDGFLHAWHCEIRSHLGDEERMLLPLIDDARSRARLLAEHGVLRTLAGDLTLDAEGAARRPGLLCRLGRLLHRHIRWEERVLFEEIQRTHPTQLLLLVEQAEHIHATRPGSRPRARLNRRPSGSEK